MDGCTLWLVGALILDWHLNNLGPWHLITAIPNFSVMALIQSAVPRMCERHKLMLHRKSQVSSVRSIDHNVVIFENTSY